MDVKVIAVKRIGKIEPGGVLEVSAKKAKALVLLGKARYAEEPAKRAAPAKATRKRRGEPTGGPVGAVTRASAAGITSAPEEPPAPEGTTNDPGAGE